MEVTATIRIWGMYSLSSRLSRALGVLHPRVATSPLVLEAATTKSVVQHSQRSEAGYYKVVLRGGNNASRAGGGSFFPAHGHHAPDLSE